MPNGTYPCIYPVDTRYICVCVFEVCGNSSSSGSTGSAGWFGVWVRLAAVFVKPVYTKINRAATAVWYGTCTCSWTACVVSHFAGPSNWSLRISQPFSGQLTYVFYSPIIPHSVQCTCIKSWTHTRERWWKTTAGFCDRPRSPTLRARPGKTFRYYPLLLLLLYCNAVGGLCPNVNRFVLLIVVGTRSFPGFGCLVCLSCVRLVLL